MCRPLGGADKNAAGTSRCRSVCGRSWRRATSTILQKADVDDLCKILLLTITWLHRFEAALHGASHAKRNGRVDLLFLYPGSYQIPRARCADCLRTSSALLRVRWEGMPVETWLEDRVCLALKVRPDRFKKLLASDESRQLSEFISNPDVRRIWFAEDAAKGVQCFHTPPAGFKKKLCYFLKLHRVVRPATHSTPSNSRQSRAPGEHC